MLETLLTDNPLITKHLRSRLRRRDVLAPAAFVGALTLMIYLQEPKTRIFALIFVQAVILQLFGTWQVENAVGKARMARLLDFHRFSPLSPLTVTLGFMLGAPVREWLMAAALVPFEISLLPTSELSPAGFVIILGSMVLCTLLYHLVAMMTALLSPGTRATSGGAILALCAQFFWAAPPFSYFTMAPAFRFALGEPHGWPRLGSLTAVDALAYAAMHQVVFILFLLVGVVRKIRSEDAHFTSKAGGLLFFAVFCALAALDLPRIEELAGVTAVAYVYPVSAIAMAVLASITPSGREFASGVRRADRAGEARLPFASDAAATWMPIAGISAITVAAAAMVELMSLGSGLKAPTSSGPPLPFFVHLGPALLIGVASIVTFGCTRLGFELRYGQKHAKAYNLLALVLYWVAPAMLGLIHHQPESMTLVMGFSPWVGVGLAASGASATGLLVGVHLCIAAYSAWWCWTTEQEAIRVARGGGR